ncbi:fibropellin-1-like [Ostrea edulis]|uniref:fibropellin-1-like n=1 Tax=Ostrea edulis TaxID=37623 RepID=UPI0024AED446|nr:fibropellin-1-like [Ostrea edulis]
MNFFVLTILLAVCSSTPICFKGREYVVEKCVRYRCINGTAMPESCPRGLFPASKDATGCSWPGESECTMDVETEKITDPCSGDPCENGGRCIASSNSQSYLCSCSPGYQGSRCQFNESECLSAPCQNGAICVDEKSGFTCRCSMEEEGLYYTGRLCETRISKPTSALILEQCNGGVGLLPHATYCQLYYNCSASSSNIPIRPQEKFLDECPYPQLFSTTTRTCESFYRVNCEKRQVLLDFCDYWKQKCTSICKPCTIEHPSCKSREDGIQSNPNKPGTPYFMSCFQNRTIYVSECPTDKFGKKMIFHKNKCTSVFDMSRFEGGRRPECPDHNLRYFSGPREDCTIHHMCQGGVATVMQCTGGKVFHYEVGKPLCQERADVCKPCGTKPWYVD